MLLICLDFYCRRIERTLEYLDVMLHFKFFNKYLSFNVAIMNV